MHVKVVSRYKRGRGPRGRELTVKLTSVVFKLRLFYFITGDESIYVLRSCFDRSERDRDTELCIELTKCNLYGKVSSHIKPERSSRVLLTESSSATGETSSHSLQPLLVLHPNLQQIYHQNDSHESYST